MIYEVYDIFITNLHDFIHFGFHFVH